MLFGGPSRSALATEHCKSVEMYEFSYCNTTNSTFAGHITIGVYERWNVYIGMSALN